MSKAYARTVAVVGGGVIGVSTAQQLARGGAEVVLVTEGRPASGASGRSLSWLNSAAVRNQAYHRLRMAGIDRYRTLYARQNGPRWLRFDGGLAWSAADRAEEQRRRQEYLFAQGYASELVSRDRVSAETPGVDPAAIPETGAVWNPGEGWVDLPSLVQLLVADFTASGGRLVSEAGRCSVVTRERRAIGVRTGRGEMLTADAVLLAAGAAVPGMVAELGLTIPDATSTALLVTTGPVRSPLRAVINAPRVSLRPTPYGTLAVDAGWSSAHVTRQADGSYAIPPAVVAELLAEASQVLVGHPPLEAVALGIGPKPVPGDDEPVLGAVDDVAGLHLAFTHSGATLALIVGQLLAYEILSGRTHPLLEPFRARRFG